MQIVSLILALLAASLASAVHHDLACHAPGECKDSLAITYKIVTSYAQCMGHCRSTSQCEWVTYYPKAKFCSMFTGCLTLNETTCPDCKTGEVECPDFNCEVRGRCSGILRSFHVVNEVSTCQELCRQDPLCHWHSFDSDRMHCLLLNDCPALDSTCTTCVSSEKGCGGGKIIMATECPTGFKAVRSHCYQYVGTPADWTTASDDCKSKGAFLTEITNAGQNFALKDEFGVDFWMGLHDYDQEGIFVYGQSGQRIGYKNWHSNEPNSFGDEDVCVRMVEDGYWRDAACDDEKPYVCQV